MGYNPLLTEKLLNLMAVKRERGNERKTMLILLIIEGMIISSLPSSA